MFKPLSEVKVQFRDVYAGTIDIVCGLADVKCPVEFEEENHTYSLNGKTLPSVTQLLGSSYDYVSKNVLERASQRGLEIHKEIEMYLKEGVTGTSHEFAEFIKIYLENKSIFASKCVMDIKTYNVMTKEALERAKNQTAMYVKALKWTTNIEDDFDTYVIWLPKEKKGKLIKL